MAWVDLGDLYVKKAGDNVTGSIVMANNNLSVAYDADTTYNVGTEIKSLRDSVSQITDWAYLYNSSDGRIRYRKVGYLVEINVFINKEIYGYWNPSAKLPKEFRPVENEWPQFPAILINYQNGAIVDHTAMIEIHDTGEVVVGAGSSVTYGRVSGTVFYKPRN